MSSGFCSAGTTLPEQAPEGGASLPGWTPSARPVRRGRVISVDRGADHGFRDITEDLTLLVMFSPPEVPEA